MDMTIIEKILARHSGRIKVVPGDIVDVRMDVRLARDFGGANVVRNLEENELDVDDSARTYFTFDCNPTGSDQKYAANQHLCRLFARKHQIGVYDIQAGIGTHLAIDEGLALPGDTLVSTDSHANLLGAIGCFGQGMGDRDIAAAWARGSVWFKVPETVKVTLEGSLPGGVFAKDIALNLLRNFGTNTLLGCAVEICGEVVENLSMDDRITISSMATEMGAIILFFAPGEEILSYCRERSGKAFTPSFADAAAKYSREFVLDLKGFIPSVSMPGKPHDVVPADSLKHVAVDSVFIGSCTNGRMTDLQVAAEILNGKRVAPGVILKIVPATDAIWKQALREGLIDIFKEAGALVSNAGCAGCASGQVGQNGPGERTVSTGNRNFSGKQGKGDVYLASPATAAASAIAGHITSMDDLSLHSDESKPVVITVRRAPVSREPHQKRPTRLEGKVWLVMEDDIDTDMIYHNRHLSVTELQEMGQFTFGNLKGWEDYARRSEPGDIVFTGRNFGAGSSRQQAVDCLKALGNQAIVAKSFGAIYERNAINAGFPVLVSDQTELLELQQRDLIRIDLEQSVIQNLRNGRSCSFVSWPDIQMAIYHAGDILKLPEKQPD